MQSLRYAAALQYLGQLALHGIQPGTERLAEILHRLGDPQAALPAIHLAGTNGKGSTSAYCAALLGQAAKRLAERGGARLRIGLYTSPHLQRVRERIQLTDDPDSALRECTEEEFVSALFAVRAASQSPWAVTLTFFEALTATAFVLLRAAGVDLAVIETGLGGRLDATRLCDARVTVVTSIGRDHLELLGPTLRDVAREKAGIFRPGVPALAACDDSAVRAVLLAEAQRLGAPLRFYAATGPSELPPGPALAPVLELPRELAAAVPLPGEHQLRNAALAVAAVQCLSAPALAPLRALLHEPELLRAGLAATRWPGRLERVWPPATPLPPPPLALPPDLEVWLDAAHNPEGAQALDRWLAQNLGTRPLVVLFGVVAGKQLDAMTAPLQRARHVVLTQPPSPRGLPAAELQAQLQRLPALAASCTAVQDWQPALQAAVQNSPPGSLLLVYGSIFLIAAVRGWLAAEEVDSLPIQDPGKPPT